MASEAEVSELSSMFERLVRNRDLSLFLPFIFGFANNVQRRGEDDSDSADHQNDDDNNNNNTSNDDDGDNNNNNNNSNNSNRVILINPFTQGMVVIDGVSSLDSLLRELGNKEGQPPASKESVKAMPTVEIGGEDEGEEEECVICLEKFEVGGFAKEVPCKHRFHGDCIEKWLGIHGTCPVCRHKMPVDEEGEEKKSRRSGAGGEREIWVSFSFNSRGGSGISSSGDDPINQTSSADGSGVSDAADSSSSEVQG